MTTTTTAFINEVAPLRDGEPEAWNEVIQKWYKLAWDTNDLALQREVEGEFELYLWRWDTCAY